MENKHEKYMQLAIEEAKLAFEKDEIPVGAIVVCNDKVIGKGHNLTQNLNDVTAHAEMIAITAAANNLGSKYLKDCTLYVSLEPCIMCAGAIHWAQIPNIYFAASDSQKGYSKFSNSIFTKKVKIHKGILEKEASDLLKLFFKNKRK